MANNADGMPVFEYVVTDVEKQCVVIESTEPIELTPVETPEEPTGEIFKVDPTQPLEVADRFLSMSIALKTKTVNHQRVT